MARPNLPMWGVGSGQVRLVARRVVIGTHKFICSKTF